MQRMYTRVSQIASKLRNKFKEYARTFYANDFWSLYLKNKKKSFNFNYAKLHE